MYCEWVHRQDGRTRQAAFEQYDRLPTPDLIHTELHELEQPSKENSWNVFVHDVSDRTADYIIVMDGDVRIRHPRTLENLIRALNRDSHANLSAATPIKDVALKARHNFIERISLSASALRRAVPGMFAGCLYCARSRMLRQFTLPDVLVGEDSFINAMIGTDLFTHPRDVTRITRPSDATVVFKPYMTPWAVFRNLRRRIVGLAINSIMYERFWAHSGDLDGGTTHKTMGSA